MSLSSSRASCLLTPVLQMAPPVQKHRLTLAKLSYQRCAGLGMHTQEETSLRLVPSLIPFVASSTWSRCFVGFIGGGAVVCTKNIFWLFSIVLQHSEHELSMSLHQTRLFCLFLCVLLGCNQLLVWSLRKHSDSSACVPASWRLPEFLLAEGKAPSFLTLRWPRRNFEENENAAFT